MDLRVSSAVLPLDIPIVFILAKGRSGTTLLQTMLDAHPAIVAPLESRFVVHFRNRYGKITKWTPAIKKRFINDVLGEMKISLFWEIDSGALRSRIEQLPENTTYGMICKQVYVSSKSLFPKETPKLIVDKNPIHALLIPLITSVFPEARFIHVVRDFRANASSFFKFQPNKTMRELGYMWIYFNEKIEALKKEKSDQFHTLLYEDLVRFPEKTLLELTTFLQVPSSENMLQYYKTIRGSYDAYVARSPSQEIKEIRSLGAKTVHNNLTKPLDPKLMDSWQSKLTKEQIKQLESICSSFASNYGYTSSHENAASKNVPLNIRLGAEKLYWYYSLPIWLRELKSKPNLALLPKQ